MKRFIALLFVVCTMLSMTAVISNTISASAEGNEIRVDRDDEDNGFIPFSLRNWRRNNIRVDRDDEDNGFIPFSLRKWKRR